jgi:hypothetical protein
MNKRKITGAAVRMEGGNSGLLSAAFIGIARAAAIRSATKPSFNISLSLRHAPALLKSRAMPTA